jgi:hypothetical protein
MTREEVVEELTYWRHLATKQVLDIAHVETLLHAARVEIRRLMTEVETLRAAGDKAAKLRRQRNAARTEARNMQQAVVQLAHIRDAAVQLGRITSERSEAALSATSASSASMSSSSAAVRAPREATWPSTATVPDHSDHSRSRHHHHQQQQQQQQFHQSHQRPAPSPAAPLPRRDSPTQTDPREHWRALEAGSNRGGSALGVISPSPKRP